MSSTPKPIEFSRVKQSEHKEVADFLVAAFQGKESTEDAWSDVGLSFQDHIFAYHFFIGRENGELVCAGALKKTGLERDLWGIAWISVLPGNQRRGYGRRMVDFLLQHFRTEKLKAAEGTILLSSQEHNFSFYDRLGFKAVDSHCGKRLYYKIVERS